MLGSCVLPQCVLSAVDHGWRLFSHYLLHDPTHRDVQAFERAVVRLEEPVQSALLRHDDHRWLLVMHQHGLHDGNRQIVPRRQTRHLSQIRQLSATKLFRSNVLPIFTL